MNVKPAILERRDEYRARRLGLAQQQQEQQQQRQRDQQQQQQQREQQLSPEGGLNESRASSVSRSKPSTSTTIKSEPQLPLTS